MTAIRRPNRRPVPELVEEKAGSKCPDLGKWRYPERRSAEAALVSTRRRDPDQERAGRLQVFRCPSCRDWHVGHRVAS